MLRDKLFQNENPVNFSTQRHSRELISLLTYMRKNSKLFDIRLNVGGSIIEAHRIVLCASSMFFRKMFLCGMRECRENEIVIQNVDFSILQIIVDYAYTGEISITKDNVEALMAAAVLLQVQSVIISCNTFLSSRMTSSNCVAIARFAAKQECHECSTLWKKAVEFSFSNFSETWKSEDFLELTEPELYKMLTNDRSFTRCEAEIFEAVIGWIEHDFSTRFDKLEKLMSCLNFKDIPVTFLRRQLTNPKKINQTIKFKNYLHSLIWKLENPNFELNFSRQNDHAKVIYVTGGYNVKSMSLFECFCLKNKNWYRLPDIPDVRSGLCTSVTHQYLYAIGGKNSNFFQGNVYSSVFRYDPLTNCWSECCNMQRARYRAASVVIDHQIYVVGGMAESEQLKCVEKYSPSENKWTYVSPMEISRIGHCCTVLQRHLYVIGGSYRTSSSENARLNTVSHYFPDKDVWVDVAPLNYRRSGAGCVATNTHIYVIGGHDGQNVLGSVERYDQVSNKWTCLPSMPIPVSGFACTLVCPDIIFVFGGYNGNEFISRIQIYNIETSEWTDQPTDNFGRTGHGITIGNKPHIISQMNDQNIYYMCDTT